MTWVLDPRVRSTMISDSLDVIGVRNNAMNVRVRALRPEMRAVGLAATVQFIPDREYDQVDPYGDGIDFLDFKTWGSRSSCHRWRSAISILGRTLLCGGKRSRRYRCCRRWTTTRYRADS